MMVPFLFPWLCLVFVSKKIHLKDIVFSTMSISSPIICGSGFSAIGFGLFCSALTAAFLPSSWGMLVYSDDTSMVANVQLVGSLPF